jgi:hypothetical protein
MRCTARSLGIQCDLDAGHVGDHHAKRPADKDGWTTQAQWKRRDVIPIAEGPGVFHCGECGATNRGVKR